MATSCGQRCTAPIPVSTRLRLAAMLVNSSSLAPEGAEFRPTNEASTRVGWFGFLLAPALEREPPTFAAAVELRHIDRVGCKPPRQRGGDGGGEQQRQHDCIVAGELEHQH